MYCKNCGKEIDGNYAFCPKCGYGVQRSANNRQSANNSSNYRNAQYSENMTATDAPSGYYETCSICGRPVPEGYKICPDCMERNRKKSSNTGSKIVIILSVIIALIAISLTTLVLVKGSDILFYSDNEVSDSSDETDDTEAEETSGKENKEGTDNEELLPEEKKPPKSYQVYDTYYPVSWENAKSIAENAGGYITVANSKEEFDKLCSIADSKGLLAFWMGVKRTGYDWSEVSCLDGSTSLPYARWLVTSTITEPSLVYNGVEERYLMAIKRKGVWYFNDAQNDVLSDYQAEGYRNKISFIIEKGE